ncbi:MAG TPA: SDR family NAD(P)-dependent oxidoreductase [Gemmatimonadaceae bacterium]|jgi:NAD(P)-dependent dehydrogenase (short-subunit alcohol dehydrogenase family)
MNDRSKSTYVCVITGASRGIGRATAEELTRRGATVVTLGRDPSRSTIACDLASFASIRTAAARILDRWPCIDLLVNNAGVQHMRRTVSADGIEETLAVNHLAPFLLTRLLMPSLQTDAPTRVLTVSSSLARWGRIDFDDLQHAGHYNGTHAYLQSKLANIMFTLSLARRLQGSSVSAVCVYPGLVVTDLLRERWWWRSRWLRPLWRAMFSSPNDAAQTVVAAASVPPTDDSCFTAGGRAVAPPRRALDAAAQQRLWDDTVRLVGVDF